MGIELTPVSALWVGYLGDLVFALLAGSVIGLLRWASQPETPVARGTESATEQLWRGRSEARGHPLRFMARWIGILVGLFVLKAITDSVWTLVWFGF